MSRARAHGRDATSCLQGPKSREILQGLTDADLSNDAFPYYTFREDVEVAGIPVFMTRLGYTAELGYELWVDRERAFELWDALLAAGEPQGMKMIGMIALDLFRIEGGFIIGGVEYDATVSPYECGLGWSVDLGQGRVPGPGGARARQGGHAAPPDERRARGRRGRGERRAALGRRRGGRARHAGGRLAVPRRHARSASRRSART